MKTQLIKLQNKLILVSDDEIKEGDWYCFPLYKGGYNVKQYKSEQHFKQEPCISLANLKAKKIIAGIPGLPTNLKLPQL